MRYIQVVSSIQPAQRFGLLDMFIYLWYQFRKVWNLVLHQNLTTSVPCEQRAFDSEHCTAAPLSLSAQVISNILFCRNQTVNMEYFCPSTQNYHGLCMVFRLFKIKSLPNHVLTSD
jgi:hypothetical protein